MKLFKSKTAKEEESILNSLKMSYAVNNLVKHCYYQSEVAENLNSSAMTVRYFNDKLDAAADFRRSVYGDWDTRRRDAERTNNALLDTACKNLVVELNKQFPELKAKTIDEVFDLDNDGLCLYDPASIYINQLMQDFATETKKYEQFTALDKAYFEFAKIYNQTTSIKMTHEIVEAVFRQINDYGRPLCIPQDATKIPDAYPITDTTFNVSIQKLNALRLLTVAQSKYFTKQIKYYERNIAVLQASKLKVAPDEAKANIDASIEDAKYQIENLKSWQNDNATLQQLLERIDSRKVGLNDIRTPLDWKINNALNNIQLAVLTSDRVGQVVSTTFKPVNHLIVHTKEIDDITALGIKTYATVLPSIELASLCDKYIYVPPYDLYSSVQLVKYIFQENCEKINDEVRAIAKKEHVSFEKKFDSMSEEELESYGYDKSMLRHIVYQTPNGNFLFDGANIINAVTEEIVPCADIEDVDKIFGYVDPEEKISELEAKIEERIGDRELTDEEYNAEVQRVMNELGFNIVLDEEPSVDNDLADTTTDVDDSTSSDGDGMGE